MMTSDLGFFYRGPQHNCGDTDSYLFMRAEKFYLAALH